MKQNGKWGYIDKAGQEFLPFLWFRSLAAHVVPPLLCPRLAVHVGGEGRAVLHRHFLSTALQTGQEVDDLPGYSSTRHIRTLTTADTMPDARIVSRILPWKRGEASSQLRRY